MLHSSQKKSFIAFLFVSLLIPLTLLPQERYFDAPGARQNEIRLTIFYPSVGSLKALLELRKQGLLRVQNLKVIGVFHEKECTDYEESIEFVQKNNIDWVKFHVLSGKIQRDNLFQKNPLTKDYEKIFKKSHGLIFFGGPDMPPYIYRLKTNLLTRIEDPYRHFSEISFIFHLLGGKQNKERAPFLDSHPDFPILGICLGAQSLNVGTGGTLIQDIWSEIYGKFFLEDVFQLGPSNWHTNPWARLHPEQDFLPYSMHPIKLLRPGKFTDEFGFNEKDTPYILSAHHQAVGKHGKDIEIIATSLDGKVVEAIAHKRYTNVLGVQFHPEFPILWDQTKTFKFTPKDKKEVSLKEILEALPPSIEFHKKIWLWFCEKLEDCYQNKR